MKSLQYKNRKWVYLIYTSAVLSILLILHACVKEYHDYSKFSERVELDSRIITPVAFGNFTVEELIKEFDQKDRVDVYDSPDRGLLYLVYETSDTSRTGIQEFSFGVQRYDEGYVASDYPSLEDTNQWGTYLPHTFEKNLSLQLDDEIIDSIVLDEITIEFNVISTIKHNGTITIEMPTLRPESNPATHYTHIINNNLSGYNDIITENLPDHTLGVRATNQIPVNITIDFENSGNGVEPTDSIHIGVSLKNIQYRTALGYFGQDTLMAEDSINLDIDLLESMKQFYFEDPRLFININNSYGLPMQVQFENMFTRNDTGTVTPLSFKGSNAFDINWPNLTQIGEYVNTNKTLNDDNLNNFADAFNSNPSVLRYTVRTIYNPTGVVNMHEFIQRNSNLILGSRIELPFYGWTDNSSVRDTMDFDYASTFEGDESIIQKLTLTISTENGIPTDILSQVYLTDSNNNYLDSLFAPSPANPDNYRLLTKAAVMDNNFKVVEISSNKISIIKEGEEIAEKWKNVKKMILCAYFQTFEVDQNRNIKIYADQEFNIQIGADIDYKVSNEDLEDF